MKTFNLSVKDALVSNSSMGNLLKWKIKSNGKDIYIKTSTYTDVNFESIWMYEVYSEVIASRLFKELGIDNIVQYYLCKIKLDTGERTIGCYSYSFLSEEEKYISLAHLNKQGKLRNYMLEGYSGYKACIEDIKEAFGIEYKTELDKIITLDYIIMNTDRHTGNFGFIYNLRTRKLRMAPIFDNGNSLFALKHIEGMEYSTWMNNYMRSKPFYDSFDTQLEMTGLSCKLNTNITETYRYIDSLEKYGLNKERIKFIKQLIKARLEILNNLYKRSGV